MGMVKRWLSNLGIWIKVAAGVVGLAFIYFYARLRDARRQGEIIGRAEGDISKVREAEARGDSEAVKRELLR